MQEVVNLSAETRESGRKPRADAQRNRDRLLEAAKAGFTEVGPDVGLEEIARRAGVGIGTLYRHFPTREALIAAAYQHQMEQLADAADRLSQTLPPADALQAWLRLSVDYVGSKKVIAAALGPGASATPDLAASAGTRVTEALSTLVARAAARGDIRPDTDPKDLQRAMTGLAYGSSEPGWETSALRLIDILMAGLRAR